MERNVFFMFVFINIHYLGVWLHLIFQERCEDHVYACIAKTRLLTYHELVTFMERDIFIYICRISSEDNI